MKTFRSRYVRRVLVPVMAVSVLSACSGWHVQEMVPSQVVSEKEPSKVRLTMLNGERIHLADPTVSEGEIVGHPMRNAGAQWKVVKSDTLRVPTDSVARIEIRKTDPMDTAVAVLFALVPVGLVVAAVALSNWGGY